MKTPVMERPALDTLVGLWVTPDERKPWLHAFEGSAFPERKKSLVVGKGPMCDLVVTGDWLISKRHFELTVEDQEVWIRDLGSTNGTRLNGVLIHRACPLEPEMKISFGESSAVAVTAEFDLPIKATTVDSFIAKSVTIHGSSRAAGKAIGRSHTTVLRAWRRRKK